MSERLALAQESYERGEYLRAFGLCKEILDEDPQCVDALILFSRLCLDAGEPVVAFEMLERGAPLERALQIDPRLGRHTNQFAFAAAVPHAEVLERLLRDAIAENPKSFAAHAALGNLLGRTGRIDESLQSYADAVELNPNDALIRLGYAERLRLFDYEAAREHLHAALRIRRLLVEPAIAEERLRVLTLCADDFWENHVAIDLLIDRDHTTVGKFYVAGAAALEGWEGATVFNAIADPESRDTLEHAKRFLTARNVRCANAPELLERTRRTYLSDCGAFHGAALVPHTVRVSAPALADSPLPFPFLARPLRSHRGTDLERLDNRADALRYAASRADDEFYATEFVDYRSADGYYRKYRFVFVSGIPYPVHVAISPEWMVHYFSAPMAENAWMREEEMRFLERPFELFDGARREALDWLCDAIKLEYFGVDCTIHQGKILIFEANANMLVHNFDVPDLFWYKQAPFDRIHAAFNAMLSTR